MGTEIWISTVGFHTNTVFLGRGKKVLVFILVYEVTLYSEAIGNQLAFKNTTADR